MAEASPQWVQHVDNAGSPSGLPPGRGCGVGVWIQVGLGLWLLAAPAATGLASGGWPPSDGAASSGFSGSRLGDLRPGPDLALRGARGGAAVLRGRDPDRASRPGLGRRPRLGADPGRSGRFFVGMAVLQAWPGRGFWQGQAGRDATAGTLTSMVHEMSQTPNPTSSPPWSRPSPVRRRSRLVGQSLRRDCPGGHRGPFLTARPGVAGRG